MRKLTPTRPPTHTHTPTYLPPTHSVARTYFAASSFFYSSNVSRARSLPLTLEAPFATCIQIHLPFFLPHAHVIATHPSHGCPSIVVVPPKATSGNLLPVPEHYVTQASYTPQISFTLITFATRFICARVCSYVYTRLECLAHASSMKFDFLFVLQKIINFCDREGRGFFVPTSENGVYYSRR